MKQIFFFLAVSLIASRQECLADKKNPPVDLGALKPILDNLVAGLGLKKYNADEVKEARTNIIKAIKAETDVAVIRIVKVLKANKNCKTNSLRNNLKTLKDVIEDVKKDMKSDFKEVKAKLNKTLGQLRNAMKKVAASIKEIKDEDCRDGLGKIEKLATDLVLVVQEMAKNYIVVVDKYLAKSKGLLGG
ncbi:hypothetical protein Bhyg_13321 [Pseudolycoriella hygida]|uniref:Uncharacterized protein n=1 Tax=Pseudolycoriella hygida TaxID=35572 RepID=A0A9Q0MMS0_9DIPT|nr:hypothetical protein Bhyg_13321 [Pseudolycoriella hygida]